MNIGFYFTIAVFFLMLFSRHKPTGLVRFTNANEAFQKENIEIVRIVAALSIVIGHTQMTLTNYTIPLKFFNFGSYWVAVFFLLSGYGVVYSANHKEGYLKNFIPVHLAKILVPYFTAHIIYFLIKYIGGIRFTPKEIMWSLFGKGYIVDFSWYPIVIILLYLVFYIIWNLRIRNTSKILLLVLGNISITFLLWFIFKGLEWWYLSSLAFGFGALLYYANRKFNLNTFALILVGLFMAIVGDKLLIPICHRLFGSKVQNIYYILAHNIGRTGMAIASISALSSCNFTKLQKSIHSLSAISYEIYLMHGLVLYILMKFQLFEFPWLFLILAIASSILIAKMMHSINAKLWQKSESVTVIIS